MSERKTFAEHELSHSHVARSRQYGPPKPSRKFIAGCPKMPADFNPEEQATWETTTKLLAAQKSLTPSDGPALRLYCRAVAEHEKECAQLAIEGRVHLVERLDRHGYKIVIHSTNPRSRIVDALQKQIVTLLRELGLFPARRSRLALTVTPESELTPGQRALAAADALEKEMEELN